MPADLALNHTADPAICGVPRRRVQSHRSTLSGGRKQQRSRDYRGDGRVAGAHRDLIGERRSRADGAAAKETAAGPSLASAKRIAEGRPSRTARAMHGDAGVAGRKLAFLL